MFDLRALAVASLLAPLAVAGEPLRVPQGFPTIQAGIDAAQTGDVVIVAPGTYAGAGNIDLNFHGKNIILRSAEGAANCVIDCQASPQNPHRGFLFENNETRAAVVDGFTIRNADTLPGAISDEFNGGAIRIREGASPTIRNCRFEQNNAGCWGGGVYVGFGGNPLITGCMFFNNSADDGGGLFSWANSEPEIANSVFLANDANTTGGAIAEFGGSGRLTIRNCTIVQNTAPGIGGIADFGLGATIRSSIIWGNGGSQQLWTNGNATVTYSCIAGGHPGEGNTSAAPSFRADGFHLRAGSPCRNAGDPSTAPSAETDIDGERRVQNGRVDMGADETEPDVLPTVREIMGRFFGFGPRG